ncbi:choice-of-anchor E domain-containing protein [Rhodopila globiformis]|uniref:PEP-CTERM protein-sorting domain-containing protein n=1 Tax=Rhodopila globiformis TaxID=1071 RepID=A0A2S6MXH9_RHOGL|nr:choice-of-anchor E domain-containing protein [Rhodopila globiformis]PPQ27066.1 hypothetical protein CCS01_28430 [Rhodopila globiformis]
MKRILIAMTALAAVAANPAFAATESFSHTTPIQTVPFTDNFTLTAFDTSLGTLTGIEITLTTNSTAIVDVLNNTGAAQSFTDATSSVPVTATGPAGVIMSQSLVAGPFNGNAAPGTDPFPGNAANATSSVSVAAADFATYEATTSGVSLDFSVATGNGSYHGTAISGVFFGGSANVGGTTTITYTYTPSTPMPEPMNLMILGAGMAGLGFVRRRG